MEIFTDTGRQIKITNDILKGKNNGLSDIVTGQSRFHNVMSSITKAIDNNYTRSSTKRDNSKPHLVLNENEHEGKQKMNHISPSNLCTNHNNYIGLYKSYKKLASGSNHEIGNISSQKEYSKLG